MYNSPFKNKNIDNINRVEPENTANTDTIKGLEGRTAAAKIGAKLAMSNPALQKQAQKSMEDVKNVEGLLYEKATGGASKGKSYTGEGRMRFSPYQQQIAERIKGFKGTDITDEKTGITYRSLKDIRGTSDYGLTGEETMRGTGRGTLTTKAPGTSEAITTSMKPKPGTVQGHWAHSQDPWTGEPKEFVAEDIYQKYPTEVRAYSPKPTKKGKKKK